jgi:hypothetical protein
MCFSGYREHSQSSDYIMDRMIQGLIPGRGKGVFPSAKHPHYHCSPPILLLTWVTGVHCQWAKQSGCVKLTTQLHLVLRLQNSGIIPLLSIYTTIVCHRKIYLYLDVNVYERTVTSISKTFLCVKGSIMKIYSWTKNNFSYQKVT